MARVTRRRVVVAPLCDDDDFAGGAAGSVVRNVVQSARVQTRLIYASLASGWHHFTCGILLVHACLRGQLFLVSILALAKIVPRGVREILRQRRNG